jgi:hypothetical protein
VFLNEDMVLEQEVPDGSFDFSESELGTNLESNNNALVTFFGNCSGKYSVEIMLGFGKVFGVDPNVIGSVKHHTGRMAYEGGKELLK